MLFENTSIRCTLDQYRLNTALSGRFSLYLSDFRHPILHEDSRPVANGVNGLLSPRIFIALLSR